MIFLVILTIALIINSIAPIIAFNANRSSREKFKKAIKENNINFKDYNRFKTLGI